MSTKIRPDLLEISTGASDNDTVTTKGYVDDNAGGQWARDTATIPGTPFLKPATAGDQVGALANSISKGYFTEVHTNEFFHDSFAFIDFESTSLSPTWRFRSSSGNVGIIRNNFNDAFYFESSLNNIQFNVPTAKQFEWSVNNVDTMIFDGDKLTISDGEIDIDLTTSTTASDTIFVDTTLDGDIDQVTGVHSKITGDEWLTSGRRAAAFTATLLGNSNDANGDYIAYDSPDFNDGGGSTEGHGLEVGLNYTYALSAKSGDIRFVDYDAVVESKRSAAGDGDELTLRAGSGVTANFSGANINIEAGRKAASGSGTDGDINFGNFTASTAYGKINETLLETSGYINQAGIYGGVHVHDGSTSQNIATGATYVKMTAFADNEPSSNVTSDATNDKITITQTGRYRVEGSFSFSSDTSNVVFFGSPFLNAVEQDNIHFNRKVATAGDVGNAGFTGIIDVTRVPVDLDFRMRHDNAGTVAPTITYANMNVSYLGAT